MSLQFLDSKLWSSMVKVSKFVVWLGMGAGSLAGLAYGFGIIDGNKKNNFIKNYNIKAA